jgi:hypothetical protein
VVDRLDNCPDEPGTVKNRGCKDKQLVAFSGSKIELLDIVYFQTNNAVIQKRSFKLLRNVASVINAHPEITKSRSRDTPIAKATPRRTRIYPSVAPRRSSRS